MARDCDISHNTKSMQERIFRLAQRDFGLNLTAIHADSGIPYSTLRSYAGHSGEPSEMPVSALVRLIGVIPDHLLSLLLPDGRMIVRVPQELNHDEACDAMQEYLTDKAHAHRPDSECGPAIGPNEDAALRAKLVVVSERIAA